MSANWVQDGERWRLKCGQLTATCSPTCSKMWLWRVDVDEGFGTFGCNHERTLEQAKQACEEALKEVRDNIIRGMGY